MGLLYNDLDDSTRHYMIKEFDHDITNRSMYFSKRLTQDGEKVWPTILLEAISYYNDEWLKDEIIRRSILVAFETRRSKNGFSQAKVPVTAPATLAEGEFNRYYIRAICARAIDEKISSVIAYRARFSSTPRPESEAKIGHPYDPKFLLADLRSSPGEEPQCGFPGPNSGLSIQLP